ncbi:MAG: bifunctional acetate--CoA ligase family protein/GNAT family N-acetyltransferase [Gammaproteobacteria bacterium]|nr:bifunctional acetate--CoA ligase family protein/GNAT family N-acetyltransferase [Gammaproteobacteria bacterium]
MEPHYLDRLFSPKSVALFGASEQSLSVGSLVYENLLAGGFGGAIYAINPKYKNLRGEECYTSLTQIHEPIDLALIATPAHTVPQILEQCGQHGVRAAIIYSAGFGESNGEGAHLAKQILEPAKRYNIRLLGPNCLGLVRPQSAFNATFSKNTAQPGSLALVSQSGALCTAILDWAAPRNIGFSSVVSLGSAIDIDFGDILDYLALDPQTKSILLYIEGIHQARLFMSGLRVAARLKPVVVLKAGRHSEGSRAVQSHTGSLVGADDVFDAALQRAGVVRAMSIEQWFAAAQLLATPYRVQGKNLAIISNAGGPGVMATDRAVDLGINIAPLSAATVDALDAALPPHWSHANPVDIIGDATPERFQSAVKCVLPDPGIDGVLVMLTPQAMTQPLQAAHAVIEAAHGQKKPVLTCWMGEQHVKTAREAFVQQKIPSFPTPETAVEAFAYLANFHHNQRLLMQVPGPLSKHPQPDIVGAQLIIRGALNEGRTVLSELESKALLSAFRIPVTQSIKATSPGEALLAAESLGYPVAMKILSPQISHKSDVNGVRLNINEAESVRSAYTELVSAVQQAMPDARIEGVTIERMAQSPHARELLVGAFSDPVFGPVITFGSGGTAVEILHDRAVALPPLNTFITRSMIQQTKAAKLLDRFRNLPAVDLQRVEYVLRRVSEMVCELPAIKELDINPLMASPTEVIALDARIVVESSAQQLERYAHMAIHPYPSQLESQWTLLDGTRIAVRPIRPEDAQIERDFVRNLSPQAKYFRFMHALHELTQEMLVRFTQIDYDREMAFIAVVQIAGQDIEIGVARYVMNPDRHSCEFALVVADEWRKKGIGSYLMDQLMHAAQSRGFDTMMGEVLGDNEHMLDLVKRLGFSQRPHEQDPGILVVSKSL